ncbi:DUF6090 family protein [Formosa maritima]|uniref:Uncharacterized protein n=1 Tax=Formosa maritima TaxID=2592046 RepID=A0A5D0GI56_9FLAO|nr:DUF6090 family protein [Formosa maritima]TYA57507.1 hypothetical protein FVF61_04575 [Formosa maritima]
MIKFFRHVRKNLLNEGKTSKYFKYAIGEIILVVIGILIALQINTLNEERKDRIKEQDILKQLKEEFQSNLLQLENKIEQRNSIINAASNTLAIMDFPNNANRDSIMANISTLTNTPTFDPITNDLISSGNIRLIKNKDLNKSLTQWTTYILQLGEIEQEYVDNYRTIYLPFLMKLGIGRDVDNAYWEIKDNFKFLMDHKEIEDKPVLSKSPTPIPLTDLLNNKEFESLLSNAIYINYIANLEAKSLHKRILEILDLLNKEIKD